MKRIILLFLTFLLNFVAFSQNTILLNEDFKEQNAQSNTIVYSEKENKTESIKDILQKINQFNLVKSSIPSFWISNSGHWLSFKLKSKVEQDCIINIQYDAFKEVDFYIYNRKIDSIQRFKTLGWQVPIKNRNLATNLYAIPFRPKSEVEYEIYIRVKKPRGTIKVPISIVSPSEFKTSNDDLHLYYGFFIGCIFIGVILTLFLYFTTKDRAYLFYAISAFFMLLWRIYFEGYFWLFFSERNSILADSSIGNLLLLLFICFHISFIKHFLLIKDKTPQYLLKSGRYMQFIVVFLLIPVVVLPFNDSYSKYIGYVFYSFYVLYLVVLFLYLKDAFKRKSNAAYFYVFSFFPFLINSTIGLLSNLGFISSNIFYYNSYLWAFLFEMIILSFGLAFRFKDMQKATFRLLKNLNKKQKEIFEKEKTKNESELKRIEAQLKLQTEKTRIGRDLHDSVGSQLTYIISTLDFLTVKTNADKELSSKIDHLSDYTRTTMQQLRDTIWTINKEQISISQFSERINNYALNHIENIENLNFELKTNFNSNEKIIHSFQMLHLYRILQECINNTIKHSKGSKIILSIVEENDNMKISYFDNGKGFDIEKVDTVNHYGLTNIQNRCSELNGTMAIESNPENGTRFDFEFILLNTPISVL
jgi:two-component system, sensor histidine kinase LadS